MKKRFTDEQIVGFLRQVESGEKSVAEACREGGFSQPTFYVWKKKLGLMAEPEVKRLRELEKQNARLKRLLAERDFLWFRHGQGVSSKKVAGTAERRAAVVLFVSRKMSSRRACWWLGLSRSWVRYVPVAKDDGLGRRLMELAREHPRYGTRRLWALLRREGRGVNLKRVRRLCRKHGLMLKQRRRRKRRGIGIGVPCRAEWPNQVWAYDFVEDRTESGRKLRILTVIDEFTRECVTVEIEYRMNAAYVADALSGLFAGRGTPRFVRSDNGPEFIARHLMRVLAGAGVSVRHIEPGSPWQNGVDERFNGSLRDECLNMETFYSRDQARAVIKLYGQHYNDQRPHSSLGYQTPLEFARAQRDSSGSKYQDSGVPLTVKRLPSGRHRDRKPLSSDGLAAAGMMRADEGPDQAAGRPTAIFDQGSL
jgi:putative transposase